MKRFPKILLLGLSVLSFSCAGEQPAPQPPEPEVAAGPDLRGEEVSYSLNDVDLTGYLAYDANQGRLRPGIIIVHEWWGHNDYVRRRADMLAEMGYTAFALDMFGDGKVAEHPDDAQKFVNEVLSNLDEAVARFEEAKRILESHPTTDSTKIAAIGYCFGGSVVLHMARIGSDLDAVATFHAGLETGATADSAVTSASILVLSGADDPMVTQEQIAAFEKEMTDAGVDYEVIEYEGAKHSFTNPAATEMGQKFGMPIEYNAKADSASWAELEQFLEETF